MPFSGSAGKGNRKSIPSFQLAVYAYRIGYIWSSLEGYIDINRDQRDNLDVSKADTQILGQSFSCSEMQKGAAEVVLSHFCALGILNQQCMEPALRTIYSNFRTAVHGTDGHWACRAITADVDHWGKKKSLPCVASCWRQACSPSVYAVPVLHW